MFPGFIVPWIVMFVLGLPLSAAAARTSCSLYGAAGIAEHRLGESGAVQGYLASQGVARSNASTGGWSSPYELGVACDFGRLHPHRGEYLEGQLGYLAGLKARRDSALISCDVVNGRELCASPVHLRESSVVSGTMVSARLMTPVSDEWRLGLRAGALASRHERIDVLSTGERFSSVHRRALGLFGLSAEYDWQPRLRLRFDLLGVGDLATIFYSGLVWTF